GRSERVVGEALRQLPASRRPLLFSKFGLGDDSANRRKSGAAGDVVRECEASLARLGVGRIDLFQLHWPAPEPIAETARACAGLLAAGKIRAIGVCNVSVAQCQEWTATGTPLHSVQNPYSILRQQAADELLPWCFDHGTSFLAYSPLFRGLLHGTWKADKSFPPGDTRAEHKDYQGRRFQRHLAAIEELRAIASADELSVAQLCVGALTCTPGLTGCIIGARNAAQGTAIGELGMPITARQLAAVEDIVARLEADLAAMPT
ncbi:MAG: aldo/keto reductase, partial [Planctomycetes bacterium]|nr:aldo/keto reductase [Planctomycetota bacterium]